MAELLRRVPGAAVVGQAGHEEQAVIAAALSKPDVVLTELNLERGSGLAAVRRLRASGFRGTAYLVTDADESEHGPKCIEAGIDGFYDKARDLERLMHALRVLATAPMQFGGGRSGDAPDGSDRPS